MFYHVWDVPIFCCIGKLCTCGLSTAVASHARTREGRGAVSTRQAGQVAAALRSNAVSSPLAAPGIVAHFRRLCLRDACSAPFGYPACSTQISCPLPRTAACSRSRRRPGRPAGRAFYPPERAHHPVPAQAHPFQVALAAPGRGGVPQLCHCQHMVPHGLEQPLQAATVAGEGAFGAPVVGSRSRSAPPHQSMAAGSGSARHGHACNLFKPLSAVVFPPSVPQMHAAVSMSCASVSRFPPASM